MHKQNSDSLDMGLAVRELLEAPRPGVERSVAMHAVLPTGVLYRI